MGPENRPPGNSKNMRAFGNNTLVPGYELQALNTLQRKKGQSAIIEILIDFELILKPILAS
jgi:hypothetical protein